MQNQIQQRTLLQLKSIDPFEDLNKRFECTITITKLAEKQSWCYPACTRCNSGTRFDGTVYICKKEQTVCSQIVHRYKICVIGTDGTSELQFMLFDERGTSLTGKPAEKLVKQYGRFDTPPEIAGLVGHKITVVVKVIPGQSIKPENDDPTFDILNIRKRHRKDSMLWTFNNEQIPAVLPTSFPQPANLPPLVPIETKKEGNQSSSSHKYASQHIQYMDIDQTGILDDTNMSTKRTFQGNDDSDKEKSDDSDSNSTMLKKGKRART
ncbi:unnamed protein product [Urochloa decumbens]|uniref:Replication factor A C-terminal domain-containing protein n=1 Tax=Urochloa decumbens TaxID=240449 RepID=A0ABC9FBD1_9POAL